MSQRSTHHLKPKRDRTEQLSLQGRPLPSTTSPTNTDVSVVPATRKERYLGITIDGRLPFSSHITVRTCSCRFMRFNIRWRVKPEGHAGFGPDSCHLFQTTVTTFCWSGLHVQLIQSASSLACLQPPRFSHAVPSSAPCTDDRGLFKPMSESLRGVLRRVQPLLHPAHCQTLHPNRPLSAP